MKALLLYAPLPFIPSHSSLLISLCFALVALSNPVFPDQYEVNLTVTLPYVPVVEPVHVWY